VAPTHPRAQPDLPEHLAGITAAESGLAEPVSQRHESTSGDHADRQVDLPQQTAEFVEPSPGTPLVVMRTHLTDVRT